MYFRSCQGMWVLNFFLPAALLHHREASGDCGHCSFPCLSSIVLMPVIPAIALNVASSPNPAPVFCNSPLVKPSSGSCRTLNGAHLKPHAEMKITGNQHKQQQCNFRRSQLRFAQNTRHSLLWADLCPLPNSYVEALTPRAIVIEDGGYRR